MFNAKQILVSVLIPGCCVLSLAACGQTGDLYLPTRAAAPKPAAPAPASTPAASPPTP
ncbi:MAG: LPS translocon maturation chaperone LptM [Rhodoferax sp.]